MAGDGARSQVLAVARALGLTVGGVAFGVLAALCLGFLVFELAGPVRSDALVVVQVRYLQMGFFAFALGYVVVRGTPRRYVKLRRPNRRDAGWIDPSVQVDLAGTADKLTQVRAALLGQWHGVSLDSLISLGASRMFLALLVTFLLMAALFESYLYPFVIMFSVPLATVGGFMGLAIVHHYYPEQQLDTLTMRGFVILIGIVVNNAILIVHQALNFMRGIGHEPGEGEQGMAPREAIRESVRVRIRPIFMTTITSVAGMLPLVISGPLSRAVPFLSSAGSELYRGLGSVVVGGLIVATVFTLVVVPLLFSLMLDLRLALSRLLGGEATAVGEAAV